MFEDSGKGFSKCHPSLIEQKVTKDGMIWLNEQLE